MLWSELGLFWLIKHYNNSYKSKQGQYLKFKHIWYEVRRQTQNCTNEYTRNTIKTSEGPNNWLDEHLLDIINTSVWMWRSSILCWSDIRIQMIIFCDLVFKYFFTESLFTLKSNAFKMYWALQHSQTHVCTTGGRLSPQILSDNSTEKQKNKWGRCGEQIHHEWIIL